MIYLSRENHGGDCCGVEHLYEFPDGTGRPFKDKVEAIKRHSERESGETLEVVLTARQSKQWERALYRCGFRRVMEFSNPNTSNILRMYLSTNNQVKPTRTKEKK